MKPFTGKRIWALLVITFCLALGVTSVQAQKAGQGMCPPGASDKNSALMDQEGASPQTGADSDSAIMDQDESAPQTGTDMGTGTTPETGSTTEPMATQPGFQTGMPQVTTPVDQSEAKMLMQNYVNALNDPNLKLGSISEKDVFFEGSIMRQNRPIDRIVVNKNTGTVYSTSMRKAHPQAGTGMDAGEQTGVETAPDTSPMHDRY